VSLSPSTTRPFDAPEFLLTVRRRHPARGHCFARVSYTVSTLPFWPNFGDFTTPRFTVLQFSNGDKRSMHRVRMYNGP
jgi:hypothetical protein